MPESPVQQDTEDEVKDTYVIPPPKSAQELKELDKGDDALNRWKEKLIGKEGKSGGPKCTIHELAIVSTGRPDLVIELGTPEKEAALAQRRIVFKEGAEYRMKVTFKVNDIVTGLKFNQVVKKGPVTLDKSNEMIGSYGPQDDVYTKLCGVETVPSGMLGIARGKYAAKARFVDDDGQCYCEVNYTLEIAKDWE